MSRRSNPQNSCEWVGKKKKIQLLISVMKKGVMLQFENLGGDQYSVNLTNGDAIYLKTQAHTTPDGRCSMYVKVQFFIFIIIENSLC
jgi:hypothetical protein